MGFVFDILIFVPVITRVFTTVVQARVARRRTCDCDDRLEVVRVVDLVVLTEPLKWTTNIRALKSSDCDT